MPAPPPYQRVYSFTAFQSTTPALPLPGNKVDAELNAIKTSLNQVIDRLALVQRDDGNVANGVIGADQLATEIQALLGISDASISAFYTDISGIPAAIDAIDGLTPAADKLAYYTGASAAALTDLTSFARTILDDADAAAMRTTLGLVIGTDVQAYDADLAAIAAGSSIPQEATPAAGDFLLMLDAGGVWRRVDWDDLPGSASGILSVVEDTSPQLGGDLDLNGFDITGLAIGTDVQAWDAQLDSLSSASANGVSLVTAANYAAMRALLDLEAGIDFYSVAAANAAFQPLDADLTAIAAGASIPSEASPAAGDFLLMIDAGGVWRRVNWNLLAIDLVSDTTPQLGGDLDLNGHVITGLVIGTDVQAWDAQLDSLSAASANGVSLVTAANYANMRTLLDLEAGTDFYSIAAADAAFQPLDADLTEIAAGASIPQELTPASGDFMLMIDAGGVWRRVDWADLPGAAGGIANVVEDLTPQLGGDLDANGQNIGFDDGTGIEDDSGNEILIFQKNASAVNYAEVENAAAGNAVKVRATGDDTDVHLDLVTKGAGVVRVNGTALASLFQGLDSDLTEIAAGASIPQELTPAAGDFVLMIDAGGTWRRVDWDDLPGGGGTFAPETDEQTFNADGTWTKPAGSYTEATVEIWGAGGSGGRRNSTSENAVGGCGGSYVRVTLPISSLGATEAVTVGAGGAAITSGSASGNTGGTTSFGSWISVTGGGGGGQAASGNVAAASVGSSSLTAIIQEPATASNNVTTTVANDASARAFAAGAGGSVCGQNSDTGTAGISTLAGAGGASSRADSGNATSGSAPGGGGGAKCGAAGNSGAGAAGRVKVTCR